MREPTMVSGRRPSLWAATAELPVYAPLAEDRSADVCIVGAGIAGLSTAYLLLAAGKSVVVLDDGPIGGGETGVTTAHLSNAIDAGYVQIGRLHTAEGARRVAESHTAAIAWIAGVVDAEQIDCDFAWVDGYRLFSEEKKIDGRLDDERRAAHRAGLVDVVECESPLSDWGGACLRFPRQARFHPLAYLAGLARGIERMGGRIFTHTHADEWRDGTPCSVRAGRHTVRAAHLVVATNSPVNDRGLIHTKQAGYMTYVIGARVKRGSVPDALYWDTCDPYHYVRLQPEPEPGRDDGHDLLIVGGEDHRTGQASEPSAHYRRLEAWAYAHFPVIEALVFRWSGQVREPVDGLAFIGRNPPKSEHVFVVTGDAGMGMTHGTLGAMLITDLIIGRPNPWASLYDPSRKTFGAASDYLGEAVNMASQYADWLTAGEVASFDEIACGEGAVVRRGLSKLAAYRDAQGALHTCSAVCPHLGGIVRWNRAEATWDCPCHGSRFDASGRVIAGPANQDLAPSTRTHRSPLARRMSP